MKNTLLFALFVAMFLAPMLFILWYSHLPDVSLGALVGTTEKVAILGLIPPMLFVYIAEVNNPTVRVKNEKITAALFGAVAAGLAGALLCRLCLELKANDTLLQLNADNLFFVTERWQWLGWCYCTCILAPFLGLMLAILLFCGSADRINSPYAAILDDDFLNH